MKHLKKSNLSFLQKPFDKLKRSGRPIPNIQVLRLYRYIIKTARGFTWNSQNGQKWSSILVRSARAQIQQARDQKDPALIGKMLIQSRDALNRTKEKLIVTHKQIKGFISETRTDAIHNSKHPDHELKRKLKEQRIQFSKEQKNQILTK